MAEHPRGTAQDLGVLRAGAGSYCVELKCLYWARDAVERYSYGEAEMANPTCMPTTGYNQFRSVDLSRKGEKDRSAWCSELLEVEKRGSAVNLAVLTHATIRGLKCFATTGANGEPLPSGKGTT